MLLRLCYLVGSVIAYQLPFEPSRAQSRDPLIQFGDCIVKDWKVKGAAVVTLDLHKDAPVKHYQFGTAGRRPLNEETLFGIASNSKAFTAAAVASLVDKGLITWKTPVQRVLPEFHLQSTFAGRHATFIDLLSHRTGMPRHDESYSPAETVEDLLEHIQYLSPSAEFREAWQYNNQMFMIAALAVARLTNQSFTTYVADTFFKPLQMHDTTYQPKTDRDSLLSDSFYTLFNGTSVPLHYWAESEKENIQKLAGAGGVVTSARDIAKWLTFLIESVRRAQGLNEPPTSSPQLLSNASILQMVTGHTVVEGQSHFAVGPILYGLGLVHTTYRGEDMIMHTGDVPGYQSTIAWLPLRGKGVAVFTNTSPVGNPVANILAFRAIDYMLNLDPLDWDARNRAIYEESLRKQAPSRTACGSPDSEYKLVELYGAYRDPGYGIVHICPAQVNQTAFHDVAAACHSLYTRMNNTLLASQYVPHGNAKDAFLIDFKRSFFTSHIVAVHHVNNTWFGTQAAIGSLVGKKDTALLYSEVNKMTIWFERQDKVMKMRWQGIFGKDDKVSEADDFAEVSFSKV